MLGNTHTPLCLPQTPPYAHHFKQNTEPSLNVNVVLKTKHLGGSIAKLDARTCLLGDLSLYFSFKFNSLFSVFVLRFINIRHTHTHTHTHTHRHIETHMHLDFITSGGTHATMCKVILCLELMRIWQLFSASGWIPVYGERYCREQKKKKKNKVEYNEIL